MTTALSTQDTLPRWDLTDFYQSEKDPQIQEDLKQAHQMIESFSQTYKGKIISSNTQWTGRDLHQAIQDYEKIDELLGKLMSYGYLLYATHVNTPSVLQFFQMIQEQVTNSSAHLIFFTLDLNALEEKQLSKAYEEEKNLLIYKPWIESVRLFRQHQLTPDLEKLLHEKSVTGRNAWIRLFDETLASIQFSLDNQEMSIAQVLDSLGHKDGQVRQKAAQALSKGLERYQSIFTLATNTLAKDKEIEDRWRLFPHPVSARNLSNQVEDHVVEALAKTVKDNYKNISHRYYALKAKWLGVNQLEYWDRNAPLPEADDALIPWAKAKEIVLNAYQAFHPEMARIGRQFFDRPWIDAPSQTGKESGAFSHPTIPSVHPYILLNYNGKIRDVMTLAHELGHGIHQVLAAEQGHLLSNTPLTIAETASVFGEMLTFKALLAQTQNPSQRRTLMASKVDDMINTVIRQIAFFEFEKEVHTQRRKAELTAEDIGNIWIQTQKDALGDAVHLDPIVRPYWGYISHFIHSPFYVYAYAFGDCLVNSLYATYEAGHPDFPSLYLELLKAGGSKTYVELLKPFHLDAQNPTFWQQGLNVVSQLIDELEEMS